MRVVNSPEEVERFNTEEARHHGLGKTHSGGDTLRLVFENEFGEWLAIMVWGSACYRLKPRDEFIGWTPTLRASRQKLVINNRRFTILAPVGSMRNLASKCLGLARRELPDIWFATFGYRPLVAETFCDINNHEGTLPRQLAVDGKFVKDVVGVVTLVNTETGTPVAVALASQKEGEGDRCEQVVVRNLLAAQNLENALVGADALNCQQLTDRIILEKEGEYIFQIKDNQKGLKRNAVNVIKAKYANSHQKKDRKEPQSP